MEICRVDEVAHLDPVDAVGAAIVLGRIAHFVSVQLSVSMIRVDKNGEVDVGIGEHLQQFVARGHRPFEAIALVRARERLADRQAVGREVVVAKDSRAVGIVEDTQPPCAGRRFLPLRNKGQFGIDTPSRSEVARTCICSASVSARHSASLTTSLALMIDTSIADICFPAWLERFEWTACQSA